MSKSILTAKKCTPCQGGIPPMTAEEASRLVETIPGWELQENSTKLKRTFEGKNFIGALVLAQRFGELCEEEGHHPDITIGWGYCRVVFQTHKINGLHENDFIMAAKVNQMFEKLNRDAKRATVQKLKKAA